MSTSPGLGAVARFAASQHGVVTRSQAASVEMSRQAMARLVEQGIWRRAVSGVFVLTTAQETWHQRLAIATKAVHGVGVVSHASSARLHGLDGFGADDRVVVTIMRGQHMPVAGVEVHRVSDVIMDEDLLPVDGFLCTTIARTIVDLAATEPADVLERIMDDFERRGFSLGWLTWTAGRLHRPGQSGTNRVLAEVARRAKRGRVRGSWFQKLLRECLASPRIPGLEEEYVIDGANGEFIARVDLAVPIVKLGIEAHSRKFHTGPRAEAYDERRDNRAAEAGWDLRYVGYADTTESPRQVRRFIERLVARRATDLGVVLPRK